MNPAQAVLDETYQRQLTASCVYLECGPEGDRTRGTGYLIATDLVATCSHVVPEDGPDASITILLADGAYTGHVLARDVTLDAAVVRLHRPVQTAQSLPLRSGCAIGESFWSVGFPLTTNQSRLLLSGHVVASQWQDRGGSPAILLFSPQVAAGQGGLLQGFSGSPVLVAGVCVGHLKSIIPDATVSDDNRSYAQLGYLYACPSSVVASLAAPICGPLTAPSCPSRQPAPLSPTRPSLRSLINKVTSGDMNLDDFFQNHFERIYKKHVTQSLGLVAKINLLLTYGDHRAILEALRQDYPEEVSAHESVLRYEPTKQTP